MHEIVVPPATIRADGFKDDVTKENELPPGTEAVPPNLTHTLVPGE